MADKKAVRAIITGRVQGVNFRMATFRVADQHGVQGWVMNRSDGSVEAFFAGDAEKVDAVVQWCRKGPSMALVKNVEVSEEKYTDKFADFSVRYV